MDDTDLESLTRAQINLLNGRSFGELSVTERLEFANSAPRPIPAMDVGLPDELKFKLDHAKLGSQDAERRLQLANDVQHMNALRGEFLRLHTAMQDASPEQARMLSTQKEALSKGARELFSRLKQFQ